MKTRLLLLCLGLSVVPAGGDDQVHPPAATPSPVATEAPTFAVGTELVTVDVVVTDKKGHPISGLTRADFTVKEDGRPEPITSFEAVELPLRASQAPVERPAVSTNVDQGPEAATGRYFGIVFDDVNLTTFQSQRAKNAVAEFLKHGVRAGDRVTLIATGGEAWWTTRMPSGREGLMKLLARLEGRRIAQRGHETLTDYEALRIHLHNDPLVQSRVERRWRSYGVLPEQARERRDGISPEASTTQNPFRTNPDPMIVARASDVYFQAAARNRTTLAAIERLLKSLDGVTGRKSVILVSPGFIRDPNLPEFKKVIQAAHRSNVAVYALDTRGLVGLPTHFEAEFGPSLDTQDLGAAFVESFEVSAGSEAIALESGGFIVKNRNDLTKGIQRIADESRVYYLLGYQPSNSVRDGKFRAIKVKVARKGVKVRARKGYFAADADAAPREDPGGPDPAIQKAVDTPVEVGDVPVRVTAQVLHETLIGRARVRLVTEADIRDFAFDEQEGRAVDTLEYVAVVAHRDSGEIAQQNQKIDMKLLPQTRARLEKTWVAVLKTFDLGPGAYQAKVLVRDKNSGRVGTVMHEFEVPELSGFRISTPLLSDGLQRLPGGDKKKVRPAVIARRRFATGSTLFIQYEVYGAVRDEASGRPNVRAGYELRRTDGTWNRRVDPSPIEPTSLGALSRMSGTRLAQVEPGEYELVLSVTDQVAGKTIAHRETFVVTPAGES